MTEQEIISAFAYEGIDISSYEGKIEVVNTDEGKFIDKEKVIATARTFSCANIIFFNQKYAYLAHMLPSETVGKNSKFNDRLNEVISKMLFESSELNIIISLGKSIAKDLNKNFHDLQYINNCLKKLLGICLYNNININIYPILRSKNLLFDFNNQLLYIETNNKNPLHIKNMKINKKISQTIQDININQSSKAK